MQKNNIIQTPALLIEKNKLISFISDYQKVGTIYFPVKANSSKEILSIMINCNCNFYVNCLSYLEKLISSFSISPDNILYSNCIATENEIMQVTAYGVNKFVVDSLELYDQISKINENAKCLLRLSIDSVIGTNTKYGIDMNKAIDILSKNNIWGVSFYLPPKYYSYDNFSIILNQIIENDVKIKALDIGGCLNGLLSDFRYENLLNELKHQGVFKELILEPGRNILNPCIKMHTRVLKVRNINGNNWIYLDASIYSGLIDVYIENKIFKIKPLSPKNNNSKVFYYISGFTSDSFDCFGKYEFDSIISEGDILIIEECGAYVYDMYMNYSDAQKVNVLVVND